MDAEQLILGENDIPQIPPGSRIFKTLKTRAKVSVKPNPDASGFNAH